MPRKKEVQALAVPQESQEQTNQFISSCDTALLMVSEAIRAENTKNAFLPLPHNFLHGAESVQSILYPLVRELEMVFVLPDSEGRTHRINDLLMRILPYSIYHLVLSGNTVQTFAHPFIDADSVKTSLHGLEQLAGHVAEPEATPVS